MKPIIFLLITCFSITLVAQERVNTGVKRNAGTWTLEQSADNKFTAMGGDDSVLHIFAGKSLKLIYSYKMPGMIRCVSWHPKENLLAISLSMSLYFFDADTEKFTKIPEIKMGARGMDWNYTGEMLTMADGLGIVRILNRKGKLLQSMKKNDDNGYLSLHWHPYKNILVTGGDDIVLFDTTQMLKTIQHRKQRTGVLTVRWHPSGKFFASGDYGHGNEGVPTQLQFWKDDGKLIRTITVSKAEYRNIRWNNNGTLLATASDALRIHNANGDLLYTGKSKRNLWGITWHQPGENVLTASFETDVILWDKKAKKIAVK